MKGTFQKTPKETPKHPNSDVNSRIKQVRLNLELSQAKFCKGIFLTGGHYAEIELGNRRVNKRLIKLITAVYGVSEAFLLTGTGDMFDRRPDPRLDELLREFVELPPNFQDHVLQQIKSLKKLREPGINKKQ